MATLECQINQIGFMQGPLCYKIGMIPLRFSLFHFLLFLVIEAILTGLFLFNFETTQCKNHFDLNLVKIHTALIEILSFSCFVLFLVMPDGGHLRMPNCKKIKMASSKKHSVTKLDEFQSWVLEILSFLCLQFMLFLVMAPGRHLG